MKSPLHEGAKVRLTRKAADAFGFDASTVYTVRRLYTRDGYKALWAELEGGSLVEPFNKVKASQVR